jgi:uncharacterized protein YigA (DUF484 family)
MNESQKMTDDQIVEYLKSNPKFLLNNPDAVDYLLPPKDTANGRRVVDFSHYMVEKLKSDKKMVLDTTRDIIEVSRENMNNLVRIHEAVFKVLEAASFDDFVQIVTQDLPPVLDCDAVSLVVEDTKQVLPKTESGHLRIVPSGFIDQVMEGNNVRIHSGVNGSEHIFGAASGLVKSQAILRIDSLGEIPPSLLAFGARDPELFRDGQGTDLIGFLCGVVERTLKLWMLNNKA